MAIARQLSVRANGKDHGLTPLEKQVIASVLAGYTSKESGQKIGVSDHVVRQNLRDIISKLGVSNRFELVLFALHYHLVDPIPISPRATKRRLSQAPRTRRMQGMSYSWARGSLL